MKISVTKTDGFLNIKIIIFLEVVKNILLSEF